MKIKKFNNIWVMGLIVMAIILVALTVAKILYPEYVIEVAQNEHIVSIGKYIDNNKWAWYTASAILSFAMYYFYCCACCCKKKLSFVEVCIVLKAIVLSFIIKEYALQFYTTINWCLLVVLPCIFGCKPRALGICFTVNCISQILSLYIRDIGMMVATYNFATLLILMIDVYIWLILLYFLFNCKKVEEQ